MSDGSGRRRFVTAVTAVAVLPVFAGHVRAQTGAGVAGATGAAGSVAGPGGAGAAGAASGESFEAAQRAIVAGRTPLAAGVTIDMPSLSENGNAVELTVRVDSPMTSADHVRAIHVLSQKNPEPRVASFFLTPRAGRAQVSTRIRLATTQAVVVLAETSTGALLRAEREVIVVLGACVDGG
jgi:sulfur-oxidizing protein SoxY